MNWSLCPGPEPVVRYRVAVGSPSYGGLSPSPVRWPALGFFVPPRIGSSAGLSSTDVQWRSSGWSRLPHIASNGALFHIFPWTAANLLLRIDRPNLNHPPRVLLFTLVIHFCRLKMQSLVHGIDETLISSGHQLLLRSQVFDIVLVLSNFFSSLFLQPFSTLAAATHSLVHFFLASRPSPRTPASTQQPVCWICSFSSGNLFHLLL